MAKFFIENGNPTKDKIHWDYGVAKADPKTGTRKTTVEDLVNRAKQESDRYGLRSQDYAIITPVSLHVGDVQFTWNDEDKRAKEGELEEYRQVFDSTNQRGKQDPSADMDFSLGQEGGKKLETGIPNINKKKVVKLDFSQNSSEGTQVLDAFVRSVTQVYERTQDGPATQAALEQIDLIATSGDTDMNFMERFTNLLGTVSDYSTLFPDDGIQSPTSPVQSELSDNTNECGLTDNRQNPDEEFDDYFFQRDSEPPSTERIPPSPPLVPPNIRVALDPDITIPDFPDISIPQLPHPNFPTGGIFDASPRVLVSDGVPLTLEQVLNIENFPSADLSIENLDKFLPGVQLENALGFEIEPTHSTFEVDMSGQLGGTGDRTSEPTSTGPVQPFAGAAAGPSMPPIPVMIEATAAAPSSQSGRSPVGTTATRSVAATNTATTAARASAATRTPRVTATAARPAAATTRAARRTTTYNYAAPRSSGGMPGSMPGPRTGGYRF